MENLNGNFDTRNETDGIVLSTPLPYFWALEGSTHIFQDYNRQYILMTLVLPRQPYRLRQQF